MAIGQIAKLCVVSADGAAPMDLCRRLRALGYVTWDDVYLDRRKLVIGLTDAGRRFAIDRLDRRHRSPLRDATTNDYVMHSVRGAELYIGIVAGGAKDWLGAKANSERFEWFSQNEGIDFTWRKLGEFGPGSYRKTIPDAVIETSNKRFMVEVERSTKTLRGVMQKIENYSDVFSPMRSASGKPAYEQKYVDKLMPTLVVLLDSHVRAANVSELLESRKKRGAFYVPNVFIGALDDTVAMLRKEIGIEARVVKASSYSFTEELRHFVHHVIHVPTFSSRDWPKNWKTVMRAVYPPREWAILEPELDLKLLRSQQRAQKEQR